VVGRRSGELLDLLRGRRMERVSATTAEDE